MSLADIKTAIEQLSFEQRAELAAWLHGWEDDEWGFRRDGVVDKTDEPGRQDQFGGLRFLTENFT